MKRSLALAALLAVLAVALPLQAQDGFSKMIADAPSRAQGLAYLTFSYQMAEEMPGRPASGQAVCIHESGLFVTYAIEAWMRSENVKDVQLQIPGNSGQKVKGTFLWVDQVTGLGLVRAEKGKWKAFKFDRNAKIVTGAKVVSIGLLDGVPSRDVVVESAYIGTMLRVPEKLVRVTGGMLGAPASPVLDENGTLVGLVSAAPSMPATIATQQGNVDALIKSRTQSAFFRPAADMASVVEHALKNPDKPRQLPWIGALSFMPIEPNTPRAAGLKGPGVELQDIVPTSAGAKAGLKNGDIVTAVNGKALEQMAAPEIVSADLTRQLLEMPIGGEVKFTVRRSGKEEVVTVPLTAWPTRPQDAPQWFSFVLGLVVREKVDLDKYAKNPPPEGAGLLVIDVMQRSASADGGLRQGDLVTAVNGTEITSAALFKKVITTAIKQKPDQAINLVIIRDKQQQTIPIMPPKGQARP